MINSHTVLADLIYENVQLLNVLNTFGIKPGIGNNSIKDICFEYSIDEKFFITIISTYHDYNYFPRVKDIDVFLLIDYLSRNHKFYIKNTIPRIEKLLSHLQKKLKDEKTLKLIVKFFKQYKIELIKHFKFEEEILFPMIKGNRLNSKFSDKYFKQLKEEHTTVEDKLLDLKRILVRYLPAKADEKLVFDLLFIISGFEKNHLDHSRFEDKILIPKLKSLLVKKSVRK